MKTITVREIMSTEVICLDVDKHVDAVYELMQQHHLSHIPIRKDNQLVGLMSERHVRDAMPSVLALSDPHARLRSLAAVRIPQVWIENPATVSPETSVVDAIAIMRKYKAGSLPVVENDKVIGMLTSGDLISLLERVLTEHQDH